MNTPSTKGGELKGIILNTKLGIENGILCSPKNWPYLARLFICTGSTEYIQFATELCDVPIIQDVLLNPKLRALEQVPSKVYLGVAEKLRSSKRNLEGDLVEILGMRAVATGAARVNSREPRIDEFCYRVCDRCAKLSASNNFGECEAFFARILSTRYLELRKWSLALNCIHRAGAMFRQKANIYPEIFLPELAQTLNTEGAILINAQNPGDAKTVLEESVAIRESILEWDRNKYELKFGFSLLNLGICVARLSDFAYSRDLLSRSLAILENRHTPGDTRAEDLSKLHFELGECIRKGKLDALEVAVRHYEKSLRFLGLSQRQDDWHRERSQHIKDVLSQISGKHESSIPDPRIDSPKEKPLDWTLARYSKLYIHQALLQSLREGEAGRILRIFSFFRGEEPAHLDREDFTGSIFDAMGKVEAETGMELGVLLLQSTAAGMLIGFISSDPASTVFSHISKSIFVHVKKVLEGIYDRESILESEFMVAQLAANLVPRAIADELASGKYDDVLVCADDVATNFPWEILVFDSFPGKILGSRYSLARIHSISSQSLLRLLRPKAAAGSGAALVACPWDIEPTCLLVNAAHEAERIASILRRVGYQVRTQLGTECNFISFLEALDAAPSIIHISGHGKFENSEPTFSIWRDSESMQSADFSRHHLGMGNRTGILRNNPLVFLDCCYNGYAQEFEGKREDLIWSFLNQGAAAVVSSSFKIIDKNNDSLYDDLFRSVKGKIGDVLRSYRARIFLSDMKMHERLSLVTKKIFGTPF